MMTKVRPAAETDLLRINEIYNHYIVDRHTSFDTEPWPIGRRVQWFEKYKGRGRFRVLVLEVDGMVSGFAASSPFRDKVAYETSVETTIVLDDGVVGRGLGRPLLSKLIDELATTDVHRAYALIALPNDPSVAIHLALGYREVGTLDEVGRKLGRYHSVMIMERSF